MNKSFRGQLGDGEKEKIRLSTNDGLTGYKVIKFQILPLIPGNSTQEIVSKIFTIEPANVNTAVNFNDPTLLGAAVYSQSADSWTSFQTVIFDDKIFNQDIFITMDDSQNVAGANYYIELEQVKLDINEATVATLKDMRGRE